MYTYARYWQIIALRHRGYTAWQTSGLRGRYILLQMLGPIKLYFLQNREVKRLSMHRQRFTDSLCTMCAQTMSHRQFVYNVWTMCVQRTLSLNKSRVHQLLSSRSSTRGSSTLLNYTCIYIPVLCQTCNMYSPICLHCPFKNSSNDIIN